MIILQKPFVLYFVVCVLCVQLGLFFFSLFVSLITTIRFLSFTVEVYGAATLEELQIAALPRWLGDFRGVILLPPSGSPQPSLRRHVDRDSLPGNIAN